MNIKSLSLVLSLAAAPALAAPLQLDVYNPQEKGIFAVSSTLVSGPKEAVLFDAQFSVKDGEAAGGRWRNTRHVTTAVG